MFKVERYLLLVKDTGSIDCFQLEDCGKYQESLEGIHVVLPKENLNPLLDFVENELQNPTYVYDLLSKNTVKGMDLLANMLKIASYTNEFIKHYGGVQEILDLFKVTGEESEQQALFNPTVSLTGLSDSADNNNLAADSTVTMSDDNDTNNSETVVQHTVEDSTEPSMESDNSSETTSTNEISDNSEVLPFNTGAPETKEESKEIYKQTNELVESPGGSQADALDAMLLMIRAMATKIGVLDEDETSVLTQEDILHAKLYINEIAATTVRDGVIAVLDKAQSKEELKAITTFMAMFISYMRGL